MSTTFERCDKSVDALAKELIKSHPEHDLLLSYKVNIDFVFAYNEDAPPLKKNGVAALGIARKLGLKERALGRGDCEIALDGEHWKVASDEEKAALLDHELYHLTVDIDSKKTRDDLGRPKIKLRKHDYEFGWFKHIAERYGGASPERQQAKKIFDEAGQMFWPELTKEQIEA